MTGKEGESVTLDSPIVKNPNDEMMWCFNDTRIAEITGDQRKICTDVQCNEGTERFRDRLKLDHQTGSLTITNTRTTDSGDYKLQTKSSRNHYNTTSIMSFSVSVTSKYDLWPYGRKTTLTGERKVKCCYIFFYVSTLMSWCQSMGAFDFNVWNMFYFKLNQIHMYSLRPADVSYCL